MSETPAEVTKAYIDLIVDAANRGLPGHAEQLIREFGAKAYHAGRRNLAAEIAKREGVQIHD